MAKKMLEFSPELSDYLEYILNEHEYSWEKKKMFGHETFFLNGYMFCGANVKGIFVHVGIDAKLEALMNEKGVAPFEPREGMVMKEYLLLNKDVYSDEEELLKWLDRSRTYLLSLPPKKRKR
jgi:TfoX/Sxy family transcriptional regulator of competence genes